MELGITGQCFLSNLKASKNLPYSWISRQKCWVAAFHDVRLNSLNWDVNCKAVWLNHSSRSRDKHLGCMLSELHNCIYRSVTWSCHRDMCSATTSVLLRDMRLLHDYQQFSFRSFISAAASTNQKVQFTWLGMCLNECGEANGHSVQYGQYLRRLYEIHSFMIVRWWGRCSQGAGDEGNKLPG